MKNKLKYGSMSAATTVVFIAGIILFNVLAGLLGDRFYWKVDLTPSRIFDLGEVTGTILSDMDENVTITVLSEESYYQNASDSAIIRELLIKYSAFSNGKISVKYIDPNLNPTLSTKYSLANITQGDIIIESARRYTLVPLNSLFETTIDYNTYSTVITGISAESKLTNAIIHVLNEKAAKAVFLTGHNEDPQMYAHFQSFLQDRNYVVETADMSVEDIPSDADMAIIFAPQGDYTEEAVNKLDAYLEQGGNVIWFYFYQGFELERLNQYFTEWGFSFDSSIALEPSLRDPANPLLIYPEIAEHEVTSLIDKSGSMRFASYAAAPITRLFETKGDRETFPLLTTSVQSYAKGYDNYLETRTIDRSDSDIAGPFNIALVSTRTGSDTSGRAITNSVFAINAADSTILDSSYNNSGFFSGILNYINPNAESVYIPSKSYAAGAFVTDAAQSGVIFWIIVVFIPLLIMGAGIFVRRKRRHL